MQPDLEETEFRSNTINQLLKLDMGKIDCFCKSNNLAHSNLFSAAYALLLSRYTGDEQVLFSTIWHGRKSIQLARTFGMFVTTLPAFFKLNGEMTVGELCNQAEIITEARQHEVFSYSDFCSDQGVQPHQMFVFQGKLFRDMKLGNETVTIEQLADNTTNEPLEIQLFQTEEGYRMLFSYHAHRYSETFIKQWIESYENVVNQMLDLDKQLKDIRLVSDTQLKLLDSFNDTESEYDDTQTIVSLFEEQVKRYPDKVAVVYKDKRLTYKELNEMSDLLAKHVAAKGLGQEDVVSVLIPRCEWMAIASLGVLKAGCAYQPLDPTYPKERLNFMMQDAQVKLLIADKSLRDLADEYQGEVLFLDDIPQNVDNQKDIQPPRHTP